MNSRLFALALGAFALGVTEFAPMGLLPRIADGLGIAIPNAGMLVSAYAIGVMIGAPIITYLLSPVRRKHALIGLMAVFSVGNILSAFAPTYNLLVAARVFTSLSHGAFFGIGAMVAADLAPPNKRAGAVATMFMGLTIANIGGVPAATWLGNQIGWRQAFAATAVLGLVAMVALVWALPQGEAGTMPPVAGEIRALTRRRVVQALLTTSLSAGSMFTLYTYVAAVLEHLTHAGPSFVTVMLVVIGVGFSVGNVVSGRCANWSLEGTLLAFLAVLAVISFIFPILASTYAGAAAALFIWGAATFGVAAPVQTRVMQEAHDAPALASSMNIGAFNLGNALGAAAGGAVLQINLGYAWIAPVGGLLAVLAAVLVLFTGRPPRIAT